MQVLLHELSIIESHMSKELIIHRVGDIFKCKSCRMNLLTSLNLSVQTDHYKVSCAFCSRSHPLYLKTVSLVPVCFPITPTTLPPPNLPVCPQLGMCPL